MPPTASTRAEREGTLARLAANLKADTEANLDIKKSLGIAFLVVGAVVALLIMASLAPSYVNAVANTSQTVGSSDFGDDSANALRGPMALVISIGGLFAIVGIVLGAVALHRKG